MPTPTSASGMVIRMTGTDWERRVADAWATLNEHDEAEFDETAFQALIDSLSAELPPGSPEGLFERACAFDSTGHSDRAVPLYREALGAGLTGLRRRRATIQLAGSLRNLGRSVESVDLRWPSTRWPRTCPATGARWATTPGTCSSSRWPGCAASGYRPR